MSKDGAEELIIRQDNRVDQNVTAKLDNDEFVFCRAFAEHVAIFVLNQD